MKDAYHNFYLFRHALSTYSHDGYGDEILTKEILPEHIYPIKKIGKYLSEIKTGSYFSSPLVRCRQTTEIITEVNGKRFIYDDRLTEYYLENFRQFHSRIFSFLSYVNKMKKKNIIVCTHGSVIAGIQNFVTSGKFLKKNLYDYPQCGELLIIKNGTSETINFTT